VISQRQDVHERSQICSRKLRDCKICKSRSKCGSSRSTTNFFERIGIDSIQPAGYPGDAGRSSNVGTHRSRVALASYDRAVPEEFGHGRHFGPGFSQFTDDLNSTDARKYARRDPQFAVTPPARVPPWLLPFSADIEAYFFIEAAQGDDAATCCRPQVTLFNGSRRTCRSFAKPVRHQRDPSSGLAGPSSRFHRVLSEGTMLPCSGGIRRSTFVRLTLVPCFADRRGQHVHVNRVEQHDVEQRFDRPAPTPRPACERHHDDDRGTPCSCQRSRSSA